MSCPCGVGESYESCCEPIIKGGRPATAEALMRARYTAYARGEIDFLMDSLHPDAAKDSDRKSTEVWAKSADWQGLEILTVSGGKEKDDTGIVEFVAKFSIKGQLQRHHERAEFRRHRGSWTFYDGKQIHPGPVEGPLIKLGRNDACPCNSGKKFKKCCGLTFATGAASPEALLRSRFTAMYVGDWDYLPSSLHPDAKQPEYPDLGQVSDFQLRGSAKGQDEVELDYRFTTEGAAGKAEVQRRASVKKYEQRWLLLAETAP